jgi:hypothetical protein
MTISVGDAVLPAIPESLTGERRPTADEMFKAAAKLAAKGLKIVRVYGIREDGSCMCNEGTACGKTTGKHPEGAEWQRHATDDEERLAMWFESDEGPVSNVGILLGKSSGVVDIEADTDEARAALKRWGLDRADTVAFQSGNSPHFLFKWEKGLPDSAVVHLDGIECRLGNGGAAQTVVPPSWHSKGCRRKWLPGRSPEDCDFKPLPEKFKRALIENTNGVAGSGRARQARRDTAAGRKFAEGEGRHAYLHGEAISLAQRAKRLDDEEEVQRIENLVLALNQARCKPPYPADEVLRKVSDAIEWVKRTAGAGVPDLRPDDPNAEQILAAQRTPWERMGLEKNAENPDEYEPGTWDMTIIHGDPVEYVISGIQSPTGGSMSVTLTVDEWQSGGKVSKKILATTADVDPSNPRLEKWVKQWAGYFDRGRAEDIKGLKHKLMETCRHETPSAEYQRFAQLAAWMLDYLRRFKKPDVDDAPAEPSPTGNPKWIKVDGEIVLAFRLQDAWRKAADQAKGQVTVQEYRSMDKRIRRITGEKSFERKTRRGQADGKAKGLTYWDDRHLEALDQLAAAQQV